MTDHRLDRRDLLKTAGAGILAAGASGVAQATDEDDAETEDATEIQDWHDLDAVRDDLDGEYVLVADLDSDTDGYDEHVATPEGGFEPIGDFDLDEDVEFTGTFDGNGNEIADLSIDRPDEEDVGLFSANDGVIENVTLTNAAVTGDQFVGGLGGFNDGEISESSADATVTGDSQVGGLVGQNFDAEIESSSAEADVTGDFRVGGLVGGNVSGEIASSAAEGDVTGDSQVGGLVGSNSGEIASSSAAGDVTGDQNVGGLVGNNFGGEIESSSAAGDVTGSSDVGGLVGWNEGGIESSSAEADVTGDSQVGGLVGRNGSPFDEAEIESSFATGAVDGESVVGGVVGENDEDDTIVIDTYWDVEATGQQDGIGDGEGDATGLDTDEMQGEVAAENMTALDFEETWQTIQDDYPILQWQGPDEGTVTGTITNEDDNTLTGIEVAFLDTDSGTEIATTVTDEDGTYEVELAVGDYEAVVEELGFGPFEEPVTVEVDEETVLDIELQSQDPGTVGGTVTDTDENPLNGVEVSAVFEGEDIETTTTDDNGAYELTLAPATYTVEAVADGFQRGTASVTVEEDDSVEQDFELAEGPPALPGQDDPPQDLNGDGLFEDVNGDDNFDILDVQALFDNLDSDAVQNNAAAFDFSGLDPEEVTIFDVQALFNRLGEFEDWQPQPPVRDRHADAWTGTGPVAAPQPLNAGALGTAEVGRRNGFIR